MELGGYRDVVDNSIFIMDCLVHKGKEGRGIGFVLCDVRQPEQDHWVEITQKQICAQYEKKLAKI